MTLEKITLKVSLFGENFEDMEIDVDLETLMTLMNYRTNAGGEFDPKGSYPKGLWLYIEATYKALKATGQLKSK